MRYDLAGTSYKTSAGPVGASSGCPDSGCRGYELMQDLDFDVNGDGRTWRGDGDGGYTLDPEDNADYFPVGEDGTGGWLPIGDDNNPFIAAFDGNGHSIRNLAIRRNQKYIGLFGRTGREAAIRNLGLIDSLADYSGSSIYYIGGLVGRQVDGSITASYATGAAQGGNGRRGGPVGGLVGWQESGSITASYATGVVEGGDGAGDYVGGLVGRQDGGVITASYATGAADGGDGAGDSAGGLVGRQVDGSITASYATGGAADGGAGAGDSAGGLVGRRDGGVITASYGFGEVVGEVEQEGGSDGSTKPEGVSAAAQLTAANAGPVWDSAGNSTMGAWDFGTDSRIPALKYADYDAAATAFACDHFPVGACGTLLPGQESLSVGGPPVARPGAIVRLTASIRHLSIESWNWQQLAGVPVILKGADTATPTFTMPATLSSLEFKLTAQARGSEEDSTSSGEQFSSRIIIFPLIDADGNGLIEIYSLLDLHNMRYNLAGTSYRTGAASVGSSRGCPDSGCRGYELVQDLDFDGDGDGQTWRGDGDGGYTLDPGDNADYFPVEEDGIGGWLPIGDDNNPFIAAFDGNGHSIRNLAIRRNQEYIGLFGSTGSAAAIGNLGLIDNLADYTGSSSDANYIGGLVGLQDGGSIMESFAIGAVEGGGGDHDFAGGLVGYKRGGLITASYATGGVAGRGGSEDAVGGLVGRQDGGSIMASYASGTAAGGAGAEDGVGGLVGQQFNGLIMASYATGAVFGGNGDSNSVGGLVGRQDGGSIMASYASGTAAGGAGAEDGVGGLVGQQFNGLIMASYATGAVFGGNGDSNSVGGLMGEQHGGVITASYATGAVFGGNGDSDSVGGLVGLHRGGVITASYATGTADGGGGDDDLLGRLVGRQDEDGGSGGLITESYGFGDDGSTKPGGVSLAAQLTAANAGSAWNDAGRKTLGAWDFGTDSQLPALKYADYDGASTAFDCNHFPVDVCGTLLPGQESVIANGPAAAQPPGAIITLSALIRDLTIGSWDWQQLAGAAGHPQGRGHRRPDLHHAGHQIIFLGV